MADHDEHGASAARAVDPLTVAAKALEGTPNRPQPRRRACCESRRLSKARRKSDNLASEVLTQWSPIESQETLRTTASSPTTQPPRATSPADTPSRDPDDLVSSAQAQQTTISGLAENKDLEHLVSVVIDEAASAARAADRAAAQSAAAHDRIDRLSTSITAEVNRRGDSSILIAERDQALAQAAASAAELTEAQDRLAVSLSRAQATADSIASRAETTLESHGARLKSWLDETLNAGVERLQGVEECLG